MTTTVKHRLAALELVLDLVSMERLRQDQKWGVQTHTPLKWYAILGEEYGEFGKAYLECENQDTGGNGPDHINIDDHMIEEMVQVAAVAVASIQDMLAQQERASFEK